MNLDDTVATALRETVATVEPDPACFDRIRDRARRPRRPRAWVPAAAGVVVLALVAAAAVVADRRPAPDPAGDPAAPYVEGGAVWPFPTRGDADAWRRDPSRAPYLADPVRAADVFARRYLGLAAPKITPVRLDAREVELALLLPADQAGGVSPLRAAYATLVLRTGPDGAAPWVVGQVRSPALSPPEYRDGALRGAGEGRVELRGFAPDGGHRVLAAGDGRAPLPVATDEPYASVLRLRTDVEGRLAAVAAAPLRLRPGPPAAAPPADPARPAWYLGVRGRRTVRVDTATGGVTPVGPDFPVDDAWLAADVRTVHTLAFDGECGTSGAHFSVDPTLTDPMPGVSYSGGRLRGLVVSSRDSVAVDTGCPGSGRAMLVRSRPEPAGYVETAVLDRAEAFRAPTVHRDGGRYAYVRVRGGREAFVVTDGGASVERPVLPGCRVTASAFGAHLVTAQECADGRARLVSYAGAEPVAEADLGTEPVVSLDYDSWDRHLLVGTATRAYAYADGRVEPLAGPGGRVSW